MATTKPSLDTIFCAAIAIASQDERLAYLARACGANHALQARVEKLVDAHARAGSFLEEPAVAPLATGELLSAPPSSGSGPSEGPGTVIGPYKLLEQIGEGGFGVVFMAEQQQPVRRKVALKVIKPGMDSKAGRGPLRGRAAGAGADGPRRISPRCSTPGPPMRAVPTS